MILDIYKQVKTKFIMYKIGSLIFLVSILVFLSNLFNLNLSAQPYSCTDSDGGKSYYTSGYILTNDPQSSKNISDQCLVQITGNNYKQTTTSCSPSDGTCYVEEVYCDTNSYYGYTYDTSFSCTNGCQNKACLSTPANTSSPTPTDNPPTVTASVSPSSQCFGLNFTLSITANDDNGIYSISWSGAGASGSSWSNSASSGPTLSSSCSSLTSCLITIQINATSQGTHTMTVTATDNSGKTTTSTTSIVINYCTSSSSLVPTCVDSDGNGAYQIKGTVTLTYPNGTVETKTDFCEDQTTIDYYCKGTYGAQGLISMKIGKGGYNLGSVCSCHDGACLSPNQTNYTSPSPTPTTTPTSIGSCTDSDGGQNYYVKGVGTGIYAGTIPTNHLIYGQGSDSDLPKSTTNNYSTYYDHCSSGFDGNQLNEAYCSSDGKLYGFAYKCPYGCKDGVCISPPFPTPTITPTTSPTQTPNYTTPSPIITPTISPTYTPPTSCNTDSDCAWRITNSCPEEAGATWDCASLTNPPPKLQPNCLKVKSPKPNFVCGCLENTCVVYKDQKPTEPPRKIGHTDFDTTKLLAVIIQMEQLKIKFDFLKSAVLKLSDYYNLTGNTNLSAKWSKASQLLEDGINRLDSLKNEIKTKLENFTVDDLRELKKEIKSIIGLIKEVVKTVL